MRHTVMEHRDRHTGTAHTAPAGHTGIMDLMRPTSRRPSRPAVRRPGLALVAAATLLALSACGGDELAADPTAGEPSASESPTEPSEPAEPTPTEEPSAPVEEPPAGTNAVPVYFVGDTGSGPRLFREFRKVSGEPALGAAEMAASGQPADPDYRSAFPEGGGFSAVEHSGGTIEVTVSDDAWVDRPSGMSAGQARLAVQSLVHTVQGALQSRDPVVVTSAGGATTLLGVETSGGVRNADPLDVLSLVMVTTPEQDAEVSGSFTASGIASSFEANVPWELRDSSDAVVANGFATAEGWMDALYPWETEVDVSGLEPGTYTFLAMTDDPSGGEGNPPMFDTKEITVG